MTKQATTTTTTMTMKRMTMLLALMMAALIALSTLAAPDAEAKKRKKPSSFNPVQCQTNGPCNGTAANDHYVLPDPFEVVTVDDQGGSLDIVNLSKLNRADFQIFRDKGATDGEKLFVNGNGPGRTMIINNFFSSDDGTSPGSGKIEYFVFKDGVLSAEQLGIENH